MKTLKITNVTTFMNQSSEQILWICDKTFSKQFFISPVYERIWRHSLEILCSYSKIWLDFLISKVFNVYHKKLYEVYAELEQPENNVLYFHLLDQDNHNKYIKDTAYRLINNKGKHIGFAGLGEPILEAEYLTIRQNQKKDNPLYQQYTAMNSNKQIILTHREQECINFLKLGLTAKQTAIKMHLSPRTVTFHLDNARFKAGCRTKLDLLAKVMAKSL